MAENLPQDTSSEPLSESEQEQEVSLCDPCQWPVIRDGKRQKCGWVGKSLRGHIKSHKKADRKTSWSIEEYRAKFPSYNIGEPTYSPPAEQVKKFREANPNYRDGTEDDRDTPKPEKRDKSEESVEQRFNELWAMVQRDPAAKIMAREVAEDEQLLSDLRADYKKALHANKPEERKRLGIIAEAIGDTQERLQKAMKSLDLTVEARRRANQLGDDTVSQLISNYGGTLRRMSPQRQQLFFERIAAVKAVMGERIRVRLLDEVTDAVKVNSKHDADDIATTILGYSKQVV